MATPIVIGAGPAGMHLARRLARHEEVLVLDADPDSPQATEARPQLLAPLSFDPSHSARVSPGTPTNPGPLPPTTGLRLLSGRRAVRIDRNDHRVIDETGQAHGYSRLFLALGASPRWPTLLGSRLTGVQTLYTRRQLNILLDALDHREPLLIVGGGLLAVELAALAAGRTSVTLIARRRLLRRYLSPDIGASVVRHLEIRGVRVLEQAPPHRLLGRHRVTGVVLADGRSLTTRRVVLACGITPNTRLAGEAGLATDEGILVNADMRSPSDPRIFAVGDCAQPPWPSMRGNIVQVLYLADLALAAAAGEPPPPPPEGLLRECRLGDDTRLVVAGPHPPSVSTSSATPTEGEALTVRRGTRVLRATLQQQRIVAFEALLPSPQARRLTERWSDHGALSRTDMVGLRWLAWLPPRRPSDPLVCRCAGVRHSALRAAIAEHGSDPAMIRQATRAGDYCGNCLDEIAGLAGRRPWRSRLMRWSMAVTTLLLVGVLGALPVWPVPDSVLPTHVFTAYRLMTDAIVRELSGYLLLLAILLTLVIRGGPRRYWWHGLLGGSALLLMPLHALGGLSSGAGLNAGLVALMLLVVLSGALVMLHRRPLLLRLGHRVATLLLLVATLLHLVFIYQY
ncbi:FAD-dependent oxidoreductase [Halomonas icarae]|uniref:FAD-dependent oxidoreductase n=1 Tax=Halomonas icarae TaxID=2691040 RepID=A0A7X5AM37_9GAMM|nr:FAD-dependent oxidoreductase [Halomonas icarae]MDR5902605.1 FAD-dependent oxidoreductase [Halomonas icarae]NAW12464.1 FAD-dependent oxidoreductase [Halomonas icarae]